MADKLPGRPTDSATRSEWNAYAASLGVDDPAALANKAAVMEAADAAAAQLIAARDAAGRRRDPESLRAAQLQQDAIQPELDGTERRQLRELIAQAVDAGTIGA